MDRVCPACNHRNDISANFCSSCGERIAAGVDDTTAAIPIVDEVEPAEIDHLRDRQAFEEGTGILVVEDGPKNGSRYALDKDVVTAGRHPESDIFLDDVTVSRRHVEITRRNGAYLVADVGALNGTYINKELVEEAELADGDELQIGRFKLIFFFATGESN